MRTSVPTVAVVALLTASCASAPHGGAGGPDCCQPAPRTFGVTVRAPDGSTLPGATGSITADSGAVVHGSNVGGRLLFTTAESGGGWLALAADGYRPASLRVLLEDMPDATLSPAVVPLARVTVSGRRLSAGGAPLVWRFATAFRLLDRVADGEEGVAVAYLDWLAASGFNGARVLTSLPGAWFDLQPAAGQAALPRLLRLAGERGIYLELVALANSRGMDAASMASHVRAVGIACASDTACAALELANENSHPSQHDRLNDLAFLRTLRALVPAPVPVSLGSNCCGESDERETYPGSDYVTVHTDRSRDTWNRTRHVRELELVSASSGRFVVDDEPIGAGERDQPGRRSANAHEFFARGALSRVFWFGATFHCEDCLHALVPGPAQRAAAAAFVAGTRIVPDDVRLSFQNASWATSPVRSFRFGEYGQAGRAVRAYSGLSGRPDWNVLVLVGVTGNPGVAVQNGWELGAALADRPGVRVVGLRRK